MRVRRALRVAGALVIALAVGCSLAVDASDIDAQCPPGQKLCPERRCVDIDDPDYGCTPTSCFACQLVPNAVAGCDGESNCVFVGCTAGFGCSDCSKNVLIDELNCGRCGIICQGGALCVNGRCEPPPVLP